MENINETIEHLVASAKRDVKNAIEESGLTQAVWVATSKDAVDMLAEWQELTVAVKDEHGIDLPPLIDGLEVKIS